MYIFTLFTFLLSFSDNLSCADDNTVLMSGMWGTQGYECEKKFTSLEDQQNLSEDKVMTPYWRTTVKEQTQEEKNETLCRVLRASPADTTLLNQRKNIAAALYCGANPAKARELYLQNINKLLTIYH